MCYINTLVAVGDETGKKKLKSEPNIAREQSINPEIKPSIPPVTADNAPVQTASSVSKAITEDTVAPENKQPGITQKNAPLLKSKKLLTLDALDSLDELEVKKVIAVEEDDDAGDILILNQENILKVWDEYTSRIPDTKRGLKLSFNTFKPQLDEVNLNRVILKVQSDLQKSQFDELKDGISNFISKRVGANVSFEVLADKEVTGGTKPYTPKEKLERLIQKNPSIKKLQQELGLELDYD
jgi:hypothetical protein